MRVVCWCVEFFDLLWIPTGFFFVQRLIAPYPTHPQTRKFCPRQAFFTIKLLIFKTVNTVFPSPNIFLLKIIFYDDSNGDTERRRWRLMKIYIIYFIKYDLLCVVFNTPFHKAHRVYPNLDVKKFSNVFRNSFLVESYFLLYFKIKYVLHFT